MTPGCPVFDKSRHTFSFYVVCAAAIVSTCNHTVYIAVLANPHATHHNELSRQVADILYDMPYCIPLCLHQWVYLRLLSSTSKLRLDVFCRCCAEFKWGERYVLVPTTGGDRGRETYGTPSLTTKTLPRGSKRQGADALERRIHYVK